MINLNSFSSSLNIAVIGASGGIGKAFVETLSEHEKVNKIYAFSRSADDNDFGSKVSCFQIDVCNEEQIEAAANNIVDPLHIIIVASGILHDSNIQPEKSLSALNADAMQSVFQINTIGPALVAKHFLPKISLDEKSVFSFLSARVGSISDNELGGWYSYRASKSALNMIVKNISIEAARKYKKASIIGLHPGTVETKLSQPFRKTIPLNNLFSPNKAAEYLLEVINNVDIEDSGKIFAWNREEIDP